MEMCRALEVTIRLLVASDGVWCWGGSEVNTRTRGKSRRLTHDTLSGHRVVVLLLPVLILRRLQSLPHSQPVHGMYSPGSLSRTVGSRFKGVV